MAEPSTIDIEPYRIKAVPGSMYYIPNFINETEEAYILDKIPPNQWISLTHRRLQAIPSRLTASNALVTSKSIPEWLSKPGIERVNNLGIFKDSPHGAVNHCLINEYLPGQGIMPHEDGAAYYPVVATISLGASIVLDVTEKTDHFSSSTNDHQTPAPRRWRILQEPRSLLVTTGSAYTDTLHGIAEVNEDVDLSNVANWSLLGDSATIVANGGRNERNVRISLTLRDVLKVSNVGAKVFGKMRS